MFWTILLAVATGMRTFTGIAVICWGAYLGYIPVQGTWAFWTAKLITVIVVTVLALGEYVGDTLPRTPSRTTLMPLLARLGFGVFIGVMMATVMDQPKVGGILFGAIGALIGTYGGYRARMFGARLLKRDLPMALFESAVALALSVFAVAMIHKEIVIYMDRAAKLAR